MNEPAPVREVKMMTAEEARKRVETINSQINNVRALVLDFHDREGWRALGYESWVDCVKKEFSIGQSHVYRLFEAAKIEARISPIGENAEPIPESQLRPLAAVPPKDQPTVYQLAKETAPEGKLTARHVETVVREIQGRTQRRGVSGITHDAMYFADLAIKAIENIQDYDSNHKQALAKIALHVWNRQHKVG